MGLNEPPKMPIRVKEQEGGAPFQPPPKEKEEEEQPPFRPPPVGEELEVCFVDDIGYRVIGKYWQRGKGAEVTAKIQKSSLNLRRGCIKKPIFILCRDIIHYVRTS